MSYMVSVRGPENKCESCKLFSICKNIKYDLCSICESPECNLCSVF